MAGSRRGLRLRRFGVLLGMLLIGWNCGGSAPALPAGPAPRLVDQTCPETILSDVPPDLQPRERRLVPYARHVRGVEVTWSAPEAGRRLVVISGGYLDEVVESFDDLREAGGYQVDTRAMTLLAGQFLGQPVHVASWSETATVTPCQTHGLVAVGLNEWEFRWVLDGVHTRSARGSDAD